MKFLLDENVEYRLATFLTNEGHDVTTTSPYLSFLPHNSVKV